MYKHLKVKQKNIMYLGKCEPKFHLKFKKKFHLQKLRTNFWLEYFNIFINV